jgi:hypothetical protein
MTQLENFKRRLAEVDILRQAASEAFKDRSPEGRDRGNAFSRAGVVMLAGHFEGFLRDLIVEFVEKFNQEAMGVTCAPVNATCIALKSLIEGTTNGNWEAQNKLLDIISNNAPIKLDPKHFKDTESNPTVDVVEAIFSRVGIDMVLEALTQADFAETTFVQISQFDQSLERRIRALLLKHGTDETKATLINEELKTIIEQRWNSKTRRRDVGYVAAIQELLKLRNRIAHGEEQVKVTDFELEKMINSIQSLASGLGKTLDNHLYSIALTRTEAAVAPV